MGRLRKKNLIGRIILVQEDRFRMVGDSGRGYLLTLSHKSRTGREDLERWNRQNARVHVEYVGEPNLASGIAMAVRPCRESKPPSLPFDV